MTVFVLSVVFAVGLNGQTTNNNMVSQNADSLSLKSIIDRIITSHPGVKSAEEAIKNADARIGLAKTGYYPVADLTANYSNIQPVVTISIPSMGSFQLYPENNYSAAVNYSQVIYDFGRTRQNIEFEKTGKLLGEEALEQVKQKLSMFAVNNFYTMDFLQASIKIKDEQLQTLNEHLEYVQKMKETGSATEYQVLSTKVRISTVESQKVDLISALTAQQASLNSLLGNDQKVVPVVKNELTVGLPLIPRDSLESFAYHNRDEVIINKEKSEMAGLRYDIVKLQNRPTVSFIAAAGVKNGYIPDLQKLMPNYVLGLGLKVPIFDGMRNKYNLEQAKSAIRTTTYDSEITKRTISSEINEAEAYLFAAEKKIGQFELQLTQALQAYALAETSFKAGVITNLDLLDANTSVSESKLMLLKARIDYAASVYKLKAVLGERLY